MKMLRENKSRSFANGKVYSLLTEDGYPVEVTDTFLPYYTKDAIGAKQNALKSYDIADRTERWMIGVSCMSGCPVGCKFCATGQLPRWRVLSAEEIVAQVKFILEKNPEYSPANAKEFKINYTRMGEPFLNLNAVKKAVGIIDEMFPNVHHYISTIGICESDFSWIKGNITLQISLHSFDEEHRNWLIPLKRKMTIPELGQIRTGSNLKTTLNMTLVEESDFDIESLQKYFDKEHFFIKLSPINPNATSDKNNISEGVIQSKNLL